MPDVCSFGEGKRHGAHKPLSAAIAAECLGTVAAMPDPAAAQALVQRLPASGIVASLLLHGALVALVLFGQTVPITAPELQSIDIDLISMAQLAALLPGPSASPLANPTPAITAPQADGVAPPATPTTTDGPFRATAFYAGSLLAEPESARLRAAMRTLAAPEQLVQLCDIEAMEQVRRARPDYDPDTVVPYAMAELETRGGTLIATGGAFRSRREWYELSFRCTPAADLTRVAAFEFTLGAAVRHELWDEHYLTAEEVEE
jgi:hypothetical protein